jgi:hypothetical protein
VRRRPIVSADVGVDGRLIGRCVAARRTDSDPHALGIRGLVVRVPWVGLRRRGGGTDRALHRCAGPFASPGSRSGLDLDQRGHELCSLLPATQDRVEYLDLPRVLFTFILSLAIPLWY